MLARVEELMVKDVNELRILRKALNNSGSELQKPQQPQIQQAPQQKK